MNNAGPNLRWNQDVIACVVDGSILQLIIQEGTLQQVGLLYDVAKPSTNMAEIYKVQSFIS